ncbi:hypothetical protein Y032_0076g1032 [Ancylostoma ceylanicum]|nr:hypothetical protein Y032_0076g1032 [Ancylostoma ceylanicum]
MATRFQQHLRICAKAVSTDQSQIISSIKAVGPIWYSELQTVADKSRDFGALSLRVSAPGLRRGHSGCQLHRGSGPCLRLFGVEASTAAMTTALIERKRASDNFVAELQGLDKLRDDVLHIQLMLEELVPMVETLNELLVPSDRLPPLSLSRILERTPVSTSASSSQQSTPKHVPAGNSSVARPPTRDERSHIPPIEEVRVVDRAV